MERIHVALVTGAGRGIGKAVALRLARDRAAVLVAARSREECAVVSVAIRGAGGRSWPILLDVADPKSVEQAVAEAIDVAGDVGPIDWLVNNAGIVESAPFLSRGPGTSGDAYERHLRVNFHGARWRPRPGSGATRTRRPTARASTRSSATARLRRRSFRRRT
jgi:NAD(P)-dependent dehydrogenase (short-subunit alcohol dehydrogenase family)